MKKFLFFAGLAALGSMPMFGSLVECATGDDISGVTNGTELTLTSIATCSAAGSTFSNFEVVAASGFGAPGLTSLTVTVYTDTSNPGSLVFDTTNLGGSDIEIYFQATPGLTGISLTGEGENVTENVCSAAVTLGSETCPVSTSLGGELSTSGTTSESITYAATDYFEKDDSGGSQFAEGFTSSVPEPMTLSLMGVGLLGLGFIGRRIRK